MNSSKGEISRGISVSKYANIQLAGFSEVSRVLNLLVKI